MTAPTARDATSQELAVSRGPYELHAELVPGHGAPVVLMHGFPALFPHSELHLIDGAGHYVQVDQPQQVADLIAGG